ncbi:hypothetical protein [Sphingobium nicotianae]|uniref:Uncharacterized protein n=1 Tax=Sphingobium nicotianae TaxID=2782607 RepID=A0A9X1IS44_9SPHN|nr:hypothetical protein [Sphingobium nicotianae]MBT2188146.1 hypothetical protein [Sphingobium nicotianae]
MTAKFTAARRDAFLRALAETGNQTIAAERAKVSRSWVSLHRASEPLFRQAMDEAIAAARAAFDPHGGDGSCAAPQEALRYHDGSELVVRGSNGRRTQVARARVRQFTPRSEDRFLATLAATCNVKAACAEVGMTAAAAYKHRLRWPAFARRWDEAVEVGYIRIEAALVEAACNLFSSPAHPPEVPVPEMTAAHAIQLLHMHKHQVRAMGKRPGLPPHRPGLDEVRASILRKIEAIERHEKRQEMARIAHRLW